MTAVALTFDAEHPDRQWCPSGNAARVLDALDDTPAFFFVQGAFAVAYPDLVHRIAVKYPIGSHSYYHARFTALTTDGMRDDLGRAQRAIADACGRDPVPFFRLPFGDGETDPRITGTVSSLGWPHLGWDFDSEDWAGHDEGTLSDRLLLHLDGAAAPQVVLLHTWPAATPALLARLVRELRSRGHEAVSLLELI